MVKKERECICGCGEYTGGTFASGHDGRIRGWYKKAANEGLLSTASAKGLKRPEVQDYLEGHGYDMAPVKATFDNLSQWFADCYTRD